MLAAVLIALAAASPDQCREASVSYNQMVAAIHDAIRDYSRCLMASLARDDCGVEFIELQVTHRDFEAAVTQRAAKCSGGSDAR